MKYIALLTIVFCLGCLEAVLITDKGREFKADRQYLLTLRQKPVRTVREETDNIREDDWEGVLLKDLLEHLSIGDFNALVFTSDDNYQVRLTSDEIEQLTVLLAIKHNGTAFPDGGVRLIIPDKRSMFWINNISSIKTEQISEVDEPYYIVFAEDNLAEAEPSNSSSHFGRKKGYYLIDIIADAFPIREGDFILVGRDGVTQRLDYETYLKEAVLIIDGDSYSLQSPEMPPGMWIKDISVIRFLDRMMVFRERFEDITEVRDLLQWNGTPTWLYKDDGTSISAATAFSDDIWRQAGILRWKK